MRQSAAGGISSGRIILTGVAMWVFSSRACNCSMSNPSRRSRRPAWWSWRTGHGRFTCRSRLPGGCAPVSALGGCGKPAPRLLAVFVGEDIVDGHVDDDGLEPEVVAQFGDDVLLDGFRYLVDGVSVRDGHGEVHDGGAAENTHRRVRMTVPEGGALGERREPALGAAAQG